MVSDVRGDASTLPTRGPFALEVGLVLGPSGPLERSVVVVDGDHFAAVEPAGALPLRYRDIPVVSRPDLALVPGFVDCHNHVSQTFAKALSCGEPSQLWRRLWVPLRRAMSPDDVYLATKWAGIELLRGGFTTVVVPGERAGEASAAAMRALEEVGLRARFAIAFADSADQAMRAAGQAEPRSTAACLEEAERVLGEPTPTSRITLSLSCGTIHSASRELIRGVSRLARDAGVIFQMHANEHAAEVEHCLDRYGRRPIELLDAEDALGPHALIAHATLVTPAEVALLAGSRAAVSYNPVASAWKGNAVAPALDFWTAGVRFGLGTDSTRNDAFRLLDAAESAQRLTRGLSVADFSAGAGGLWVHAATRGGADAAGLEDVTGAIAPGLRADFLLLARDTPECQPSWDFEWELVRYYDRTNLLASYVDGRLVLENGRPTACDVGDLLARGVERGRQVVAAADIRRVHGPSRHLTLPERR